MAVGTETGVQRPHTGIQGVRVTCEPVRSAEIGEGRGQVRMGDLKVCPGEVKKTAEGVRDAVKYGLGDGKRGLSHEGRVSRHHHGKRAVLPKRDTQIVVGGSPRP